MDALKLLKKLLLFGLMASLVGCHLYGDGDDDDDDDFAFNVRNDPAVVQPSATARVHFKNGELYNRDLALALELPENSLCLELSQYQCAADVHLIVLGGMDPYERSVRTPFEQFPQASPIAADRLGLSACIARIEADLANPEQAMFLKGLDLTQLANDGWLDETAFQMVSRLLKRDPNQTELDTLTGFYPEVAAAYPNDALGANKEWATLSCFMVATSMEALFY